jgi:hypothetical protein
VNEAAASALRVMRADAQIALEYARDHPDWREGRLVVDSIAKRVEEVTEAAKTRFPRAARGSSTQSMEFLPGSSREVLAR